MHTEEWPSSELGYRVESTIGTGSLGIVYSATVTEGLNIGSKVAIKVINLDQYPNLNIEDIRKEIQTMRPIYHPSIASYHNCFLSDKILWIIMPLLEWNLENLLKSRSPAGFSDEILISSILREILITLMYFHQHNKIHRDIKSSNVFINQEGRVILSDYGIVSRIKEIMTLSGLYGSPCWTAPEVINNAPSSIKSDIWSFGILALEIIKGKPPYKDYPPLKVMMMITHKNPPILDKKTNCDQLLKEIVNLCLALDSQRRPNADDLLKKKFFFRARGIEYIRDILMNSVVATSRKSNLEGKAEEQKHSNNQEVPIWNFDSISPRVPIARGEDPFDMMSDNDEL